MVRAGVPFQHLPEEDIPATLLALIFGFSSARTPSYVTVVTNAHSVLILQNDRQNANHPRRHRRNRALQHARPYFPFSLTVPTPLIPLPGLLPLPRPNKAKALPDAPPQGTLHPPHHFFPVAPRRPQIRPRTASRPLAGNLRLACPGGHLQRLFASVPHAHHPARSAGESRTCRGKRDSHALCARAVGGRGCGAAALCAFVAW
jgi:hypothetical protein